MASHPNGGINIVGDLNTPGDVNCQNITASGTLSAGATGAGAITSTASYITLTAGVTPGSPTEGMIFAKAADHHVYYFNGSTWVQLDN